jgi:hypothetical protein
MAEATDITGSWFVEVFSTTHWMLAQCGWMITPILRQQQTWRQQFPP